MRAVPVVLLAWSLLAVAILPTAQGVAQPPDDEAVAEKPASAPLDFHYDFQKQPLPPELKPFQAEDGKCLRFEPEGLRITIPQTVRHAQGGMGFRANFALGGDFEVTLKSEILQLDTPDSGFGVGVGIRLVTSAPAREQIMVARLARPKKQVVIWQRTPGNGAAPCAENVFRLRLKRTGANLSYLWAPGDAEKFQEIHETDIGRGDVGDVRFVAMTNQKPINLDVRFLDVRIRQGGLQQKRDGVLVSDPEPTSPPPRRPRLWLTLAFLFLLGLILLVAAIVVRHRRAAKASASIAESKGRGGNTSNKKEN